MKTITKLLLLLISLVMTKNSISQTYTMPPEDQPHEGTWLQWPHQYEYGFAYRNSLDATWVAMTQAILLGEKVHIIAYNNTEKTRITSLLTAAGVSLVNVDFRIFPTNDVWVRDNGPIYVRDASGNLKIQDWGFNGWGGDYNFNLCNPIPTSIATATGVPVVDLNTTMTLEGGAVELDGNGVCLATRSSIISQTPALSVRNPGMTQGQAELIMADNLGITKFIWLDGITGSADITDYHIDGFAKFVNEDTLVTMSNADLLYWGLTAGDITTLNNASNTASAVYTKVHLPLTVNDVVTTSGTNLGYKGSYINYYVTNAAILVPNYVDPNDAVANAIVQTLYPGKTVVGIDVRNLYENGGMVHCVTQQQPVSSLTTILEESKKSTDGIYLEQNFPNPSNGITSFSFTIPTDAYCKMEIYDYSGQLVAVIIDNKLSEGAHEMTINTEQFKTGIYNYVLKVNNQRIVSKRMIVSH